MPKAAQKQNVNNNKMQRCRIHATDKRGRVVWKNGLLYGNNNGATCYLPSIPLFRSSSSGAAALLVVAFCRLHGTYTHACIDIRLYLFRFYLLTSVTSRRMSCLAILKVVIPFNMQEQKIFK